MKLILDNVTKGFDGKTVLESTGFTFETGKIYGLLGRNGAGKTTLFNCISRNLVLDGGTIGVERDGMIDTDYENTEIGFVYTQPHLPAFMTAYEFVKFFIEINSARIKKPKTPEAYLDSVGIQQEDQHRLLKDFSHGMQNKVQMLVTLMIQPPVLLLDEPLTSFDVVAAHEMKELILEMKKESIIIFSTHILQLAQDLCDEVVLLHHKKLSPVDSFRIHDKDFEEEIVDLLSDKAAEQPVEESGE
ncbi:ABC transporter ATP-binding protein [Enterococcus sp. BWB1-3]|uniref:ABC transporter ATP-binding protein n=1 Tax=unclassified Enterococcus TaxID=2608891 RepID=UPI001921FF01|nr:MULTISPECIES: ABC transporter ATP-binding protein [unclassified Enterococcus]MBL1230260.1 ABC transporter ATP-binding protein [Enterococcus sp. BWB1-3]MCB5951097.1 ABC transporter ATP-binding protein [Enterococcus sp. BWT-B8]